MKNQLVLLTFFVSFFSFQLLSLTQNKIKENAERYTIQGLDDSAKVYISKIEDKNYAKILTRIVNNKGTYLDYHVLVENVNFYTKIQYKQLNRYLTKRLMYPKQQKDVDLDFVKLKTDQIELIANELELKDANKESHRLRSYLAKIQNKGTRDYKLANLYSKLHPCLLEMIRMDLKGQKKAFDLSVKALKFGDLLLALRFRDFAINHFITTGDINGYIKEMQEKFRNGERILKTF